jgi:hypothetical protein
MSSASDPRCPECGGPIGQTATYCMHCSADLTEEQAAADTDGDEAWDRTAPASAGSDASDAPTGELLDPDGLVDNTLTVIVGIAGGLVVGLVGTTVPLILTGSGWAVPFGIVAWLGATAYLVRRRTVQAAVSKTGYAVAAVLLTVPVVALSPIVTVDGGIEGRGGLFLVLLVFVAVPAGVAAILGLVAAQFVGDGGREG